MYGILVEYFIVKPTQTVVYNPGKRNISNDLQILAIKTISNECNL